MTRTDITKYLIHSVRKPEPKDLPNKEHEFNDHNYFPLILGEELKNEFDVLKNIIREGGLRASLSFRNGKATIYGNDPAICFTEMPLINLLQYVKLRGNRSRFTEYGIAILKNEAYDNGARPVISGLSKENKFEYFDSSRRIINPAIVPFTEQYRYVKLDLSAGNDWTHEREWRIACRREEKDFTVLDDYNYSTFITYGLNIFSDFLFSEVVIILKTEKEAKIMAEIVQIQKDCGYAKGGQEFCTKIKYLIVEKAIELMNQKEINSIEDFPESIFFQQPFDTLSDEEKEKVRLSLKKCSDLAGQFANDFFEINCLHTDQSRSDFDIADLAYVSSSHNKNRFYRYLLDENLATSIGEYILLTNLDKDIPKLQSITYQEYIAKKQCEILNMELEDIFSVYSRLD